MPTLEDTKQYLPPIVCDIADIIGFPATENLIKAIGGTSFSFGQGIRDTPRLRILYGAIGQPNTHKLLAMLGGEIEYIPRCDKALKLMRNSRFKTEYMALRESGTGATMAVTILAPKYGISDRSAWKIINSHEGPITRQKDLF